MAWLKYQQEIPPGLGTAPAPAAPPRDPNDFTDKYNTPIPPNRQGEFDQWVANQQKLTGRNPLNDRYDYDVQGQFLAGSGTDARGHGTDVFKKPNHPTFSDQSQYNLKDGYSGGHWTEQNGNTTGYQPSDTNLQFRSPEELQKYFHDVEPGTALLPRNPGTADAWWKSANATAAPDGGQPQANPFAMETPPAQEKKWWENGALRSTAAPADAPTAAPSAAPQQGGYHQEALHALEKAYGPDGGRPTLQPNKWWQTAIGAALGGLGGYSNASGHRGPQLDLDSMTQNAMHPQYAMQMKQWESKLAPLQAQAELESKGNEAWWKNMHAQAEANYMKAHADFMAGDGRGETTVTQGMSDASGGQLVVGSRVDSRIVAKLLGLDGETLIQRFNQAKAVPGTSDDDARRYALGEKGAVAGTGAGWHSLAPGAEALDSKGNVVHQNPNRPVDPAAAEARAQLNRERNAKAFEQIRNIKAAAEDKASLEKNAEVKATLASLGVDPTDLDTPDSPGKLVDANLAAARKAMMAITQKYALRFQTIQNDFASGIRDLGGSAETWNIDPKTGAAKKAGAATAGPVAAPSGVTSNAAPPAPPAASGPKTRIKVPGGFIDATPEQMERIKALTNRTVK